jgi:hypothetical protein
LELLGHQYLTEVLCVDFQFLMARQLPSKVDLHLESEVYQDR